MYNGDIFSDTMPVPWKSSVSGRGTVTYETPSQDVLDSFQAFYDATDLPEAIQSFDHVLNALSIESGPFHIFFPKLKNRLQRHLQYKYQGIWDILEKKSQQAVYDNGIASNYSVLVVGAGPCGLKTAIETQFLGAHTVVVEKRENFTRNNVLKLWKFLLDDLTALGIKKLYGQFATGNINHIGIKTLQLVLSKVCLLIGVRIICPITFTSLSEPTSTGKRWTGQFIPEYHDMNHYGFDMLVIASGKHVPTSIHNDFGRYSLGAKMSIAVTANFVNNRTKEEQAVEQIAGLSKQYNQQFFANIEKEKGISLENIVYFKGDTHYFVMTATRKSLLNRGVLKENKTDRDDIMAAENINKEEMYRFAIDAAEYSTNELSQILPTREFALDHAGKPDVSVFDFTDLYSASNASRAKYKNGHKLIMASVGDSLLQPFWPEGTGCARGFLSAMNAAWMLHQYAEGTKMIKVLAERENLYKLLKQTTDDSGSILKDDHKMYSIDPKTRYKRVSQKVDNRKIERLYEKHGVCDELELPQDELDDTTQPLPTSVFSNVRKQTIRTIGNITQFPQKAQRARRRKNVSQDVRRKETIWRKETIKAKSSNIVKPSLARHEGNTPNSSDAIDPARKPIDSDPEKCNDTDKQDDKIVKEGDKGDVSGLRISVSDARLALETVKGFAYQRRIDVDLLLDFEKSLENVLE